MSEANLPLRPSLEVLRRQAKARLAELRSSDPAAKLSDAQREIARKYGFASWRAMAEKIGKMEIERFRKAVRDGDVEETRRVLNSSPRTRKSINDSFGDFGQRAVHLAAAKPELMDVLLEFGADINLGSDWGNGPFSVLDRAPEEAARTFIARARN